jgi:hypothetical protein
MKQIVKVFSIILIFGVISYFAFSRISGWHERSLEEVTEVEREIWQEKTEDLEDEVERLREESALLKGAVAPSEKMKEVFGDELAAVLLSEKPMTNEQAERQVQAFFSFLDKQDYIKELGLQGGTFQQYQQAVENLTANTPIVTGETASKYRLLKNLAHFYRVLGKKQVNLVKGVLKNESDIVELVMKSFYIWLTLDNVAGENIVHRPSFEILYEYSGYFLNTLAGRSYLLRRGSKVRILTTYYCILIIDRANELELNSYGIDIRPHIKSLSNDIRNQMGLIYQEQYLQKLENLEEKYYF